MECCTYDFNKFKNYLVFTSVSPETGWLEISHCSVFTPARFWDYAVKLPEQITYDLVDAWLRPN